MNHITRAAIQWIALFVLCELAFVGAWYALSPGESLLAAEGSLFFGAVALWFGVQFGRASVKRWRERAAVGRADEVGRPRDGDRVIARGTLHTTAPLTTPFSGVPAVAYGYKAWRRERLRQDRVDRYEVAYWWGEGSTPCALLTRHGSLDLRSRPWLDVWSAQVENTAQARANFTAFMRGVQPEMIEAGVVVPGFVWDAPLDGVLRRDKTRNATPPPLDELSLHEWVIAPGEPVVVIGRYSATRGGLVHDERRGRPLRVLKGNTDEVRAQLRTGALAYGVLSLIALGVAAVLAGSALGWHDLGF